MWCALYLFCLIVVGYSAAAGLMRASTRLEIASMSLCAGPGVMGMCLIFLSMMGIRPAATEIFAITAGWGILGIFVALRRRGSREPIELAPGGPIPRVWAFICLLAIAYGLFSVGYDALAIPVSEWDAFAIWQLKSNVLALHALSPRPAYFYDLTVSYSHLRYPLLIPMVSAGMHAMTTSLDDLGKTISLLWYCGLLGTVYGIVRRMNGATAGLIATALLACSMPMCRYAGSGTAEVALGAFYACSMACLLRWRQTDSWGYLISAAVFSAFMAWTKNEGLALAAINVVVIAIIGQRTQKSIAAATALLAIIAAIYLPWIFYSWGLPRTDEDYAGRLRIGQFISNAGKILPALTGIAAELFDIRHWGLFWYIAVLLSVWQWKKFRDHSVAMVGILVLFHLLAYVPPLVVGNLSLSELLSTTSDRLILHVAPAGAILIGFLWPRQAPTS